MEFALETYHEIPDDHLAKICKYRTGVGCCKYIVYFQQPGGFYCVKKVAELKLKVDLQEMTSQGDNCEGLPYETRPNNTRTQE